MKLILSVALIGVLVLSLGMPTNVQAQTETIRIDAAGASFPFPLMDLWRVKYAEIHPNVQLNYQSIGSGGGVKQHIENTVNFAASDAPLRASEYELAPNTLTIPEVIGAISIMYNLPGVDDGINLTSEALCNMYLGNIRSWNDPMIADENPGIQLPDQDIVPVHRSDGSGTTFAFTSYFVKVCPEWDERIGAGKSIPWPSGPGAAGNEGVAGIVATTEGAVGYATLAYAIQNDLTVANIENGDGTNFVRPTLQSASDASKGIACSHATGDLKTRCLNDESDPWNLVQATEGGFPAAIESWTGVDLLVAPGDNAYPITTFSYIMLHQELKDAVPSFEHAVQVVNLIAWMITDGQEYNHELSYARIPGSVANIGLNGLSTVTYAGETVFTIPEEHQEKPQEQTQNDSTADKTEQDKIPSWVQNIFKLYGEGTITDDELIAALTFLIEADIIKIDRQ